MDAIETIEREGYVAKIFYDEDAEHANPRQWDNLSTLVCWHPDYFLGDMQLRGGDEGRGAVRDPFDRDDFKSMRHLCRYLTIARKAIGILPLYLYDHSGISISAGSPNPFDNPRRANGLGWDTSMVGFAYTTHERVTELCGDGTEYHTAEWIEQAVRDEVAEYDRYLTGQVYGFTIEHHGEETDESCWGLIGFEYVKEEVNGILDGYAKDRAADIERGMHQWRWVETLTGRSIVGAV